MFGNIIHVFLIQISKLQIVGVYMQYTLIDKSELKVEVCSVFIYIFNFECGINYLLTN
ncbi:conserved hypothetical protein [Vibrio chagasii]|nr:conserved hypothetical protein [Vibrio chagasii]CAH6930130.1 conserved hypothetical protein [Vibrio chagasii]CAH6973193.1 conserved hypothetical protein [Vibrio chagasii]